MTQLERFIQNGEIEISTNPITGVRRLAVLQGGFHWYQNAKQIILNYTVFYLYANGERYNLESMRPYEVPLMADSTIKVDAQGNKVEPSETPEYEALPTEYDFLVAIANNEVNIFQVMLNTTLLRDYQGKFNR